MRRTISFGAIVLALTLTVGAGSAQAANTLLLTAGGVPYPVGGESFNELAVIPDTNTGACSRIERGSILSNGKATDKAAYGSVGGQECTPGFSLGGATKEVKLTAKGSFSAKFAPKLSFDSPGPCVYEIAKASATFKPGGAASTFMLGVGKLNKKASLPSCAKSEGFELLDTLLGEAEEGILTELRG